MLASAASAARTTASQHVAVMFYISAECVLPLRRIPLGKATRSLPNLPNFAIGASQNRHLRRLRRLRRHSNTPAPLDYTWRSSCDRLRTRAVHRVDLVCA